MDITTLKYASKGIKKKDGGMNVGDIKKFLINNITEFKQKKSEINKLNRNGLEILLQQYLNKYNLTEEGKESKNKLELKDGGVWYIPNLFDKCISDYYYNQLINLEDWSAGGGTRSGKSYTLNRLIAGFVDSQEELSFNSFFHPSFPEAVSEIRNIVRSKVKEVIGEYYKFDNVFMNLYLSGDNNIPMHRDNYQGEVGPIASVSLGVDRYFDFQHVKNKSDKKRIVLEGGSLLIMNKESQLFYKHGIPKQKKVKEGRINLTFRTNRTF